MGASGYTFIFARWERDQEDIRAVRNQVFRDELGLGEDFIDESRDEQAMHIIVYEAGGRAMGAARLQENGLIDYVAVLRPWRHHTVGGAIVSYLAHIAEVKRMQTLWFDGMNDTAEFFRKNGFHETDTGSGPGVESHPRMVRPIVSSSLGTNIH